MNFVWRHLFLFMALAAWIWIFFTRRLVCFWFNNLLKLLNCMVVQYSKAISLKFFLSLQEIVAVTYFQSLEEIRQLWLCELNWLLSKAELVDNSKCVKKYDKKDNNCSNQNMSFRNCQTLPAYFMNQMMRQRKLICCLYGINYVAKHLLVVV